MIIAHTPREAVCLLDMPRLDRDKWEGDVCRFSDITGRYCILGKMCIEEQIPFEIRVH